MIRYVANRLGLGILVMLLISVIVFGLTNTAVDPALAIAGENATHEDIEAMRRAYDLDHPLPIRYLDWLGNALKGDLGQSYRQRRSVTEIVFERLPVTFTLGALAFAFALLLSLPLAIAAAFRPDTWVDRVALGLALFGQAIPTFWFALVCIVIFSINLRWLPATGSSEWANYVLPSIALGYYASPTLMRLTRAGMIEALSSDYVRTARAKGLSTGQVVFKHALRNAVLPMIAIAAVQFGHMLSGSVVIETIFAMQGIGYLAWDAILSADLPIIQAIVLMMAGIYVLLTIFADIVNAWLDPRLRLK